VTARPLPTVDALLARARALGVDRLDARLLVAHVLGRPAAWPLAHGDEPVGTEAAARVEHLVGRRAAGEPLAYLVGTRAFHGLVLQVDPRVLVPRPETEGLVDWALECLAARGPGAPAQVVDLGTGSGAIALAIRHARPDVPVTAVDASADALACARENAARLGLEVHFALGSWWAGAGAGPFDLVVSNPPYVAEGDPHLAALAHEPIRALTSGPRGLDAIAEIVAGAPARLAPGGWLLLEHGHEQAGPVADLMRATGFDSITTRDDLAGLARLTGARRTP
jgi:release factor glutamine methyltransferase